MSASESAACFDRYGDTRVQELHKKSQNTLKMETYIKMNGH